MPPALRQSLNAILLASTGYFLFCLADTMSKFLGGGYTALEILSVSGLIGTLLSGGIILYRHGWGGFVHPRWPWYLARGFFQAFASFFVVSALVLIPLADFYGIIFLVPLATTALAGLLLKEKIGIYRIAALVIGFIGVLVIAGPSFSSGNIGYLYVAIAVLFSCFGAIFIRKIGDEPITMRYAFFPFVFSAVLFFPFALWDGITVHRDWGDLAIMTGIAPIVLLAMIFFSLGYARARDVSMIAPFHYTQMIWGILLGYLIFHEVPALTTLGGSALIILAGIVVIWREHVHHRQIATPPTPDHLL